MSHFGTVCAVFDTDLQTTGRKFPRDFFKFAKKFKFTGTFCTYSLLSPICISRNELGIVKIDLYMGRVIKKGINR